MLPDRCGAGSFAGGVACRSVAGRSGGVFFGAEFEPGAGSDPNFWGLRFHGRRKNGAGGGWIGRLRAGGLRFFAAANARPEPVPASGSDDAASGVVCFNIINIGIKPVFHKKCTFLRKKMGKYLQVRKKSLPLHPHLRNKRSCKGLRFTIKEPNSDVKRMRFRKKCKVLEKRFGGFKNNTYLCSPFASQMMRLFQKVL